ncbi:MAG: divalent-cation tolerance protein CutA [Flavobacteriales bacterium]
MINFIYITTESKEEAKKVAAPLIEEGLAACANIIPGMKSVFYWEGEVQSEEECILIVKTDERMNERVMERVRTLHSYDCPCMLVLPVKDGNKDFLDWVQEQITVGDRG